MDWRDARGGLVGWGGREGGGLGLDSQAGTGAGFVGTKVVGVELEAAGVGDGGVCDAR